MDIFKMSSLIAFSPAPLRPKDGPDRSAPTVRDRFF
jgi:hypothetical protein